MEKLNGKKIKICVFISGRGTNLKSLINFSKQKKNKIEITLVISNKRNAKGLYFAKKSNIKFIIVGSEFEKKHCSSFKSYFFKYCSKLLN